MAYNQLRDLGVTITNNHLYQLPYGPIGVAVGMEHRGEDGAYHPDPIIQSGQSLSNTEQPTGLITIVRSCSAMSASASPISLCSTPCSQPGQ